MDVETTDLPEDEYSGGGGFLVVVNVTSLSLYRDLDAKTPPERRCFFKDKDYT